jgi:hypothetical protein
VNKNTLLIICTLLLISFGTGCSRTDEEIRTTITHHAYNAYTSSILIEVSEYVTAGNIFGSDRRDDVSSAVVTLNGLQIDYSSDHRGYWNDSVELAPGDSVKMKASFGGNSYWYDGLFPELIIEELYTLRTPPLPPEAWITWNRDAGVDEIMVSVYSDPSCIELDSSARLSINDRYFYLPVGFEENGACLHYEYFHQLHSQNEFFPPIVHSTQQTWLPPIF